MISPSSETMRRLVTDLHADSVLEAAIERSFSDLGTFGQVFVPDLVEVSSTTDTFTYPTPQRSVLDFVDSLVNEQRVRKAKGLKCSFKAAIRGVRGVAKTTLVIKLQSMRNIVFQESPFQCVVTKSLDNTLLTTNPIRSCFLREGPLRRAVGRINAPTEGEREAFGSCFWVACIQDWCSAMFPRGRGQEVRGINYGPHRPWTFFLDDWEKDEELLNPDIRRKAWDYLIRSVLFAVPQFESANIPWQIWFTDSNKHPDSCLARIMAGKDNGWEKLDVEIMDDDYRSLDESFIKTETIAREIVEARANGTIDQWHRERTARKHSQENALFDRADFRYYTEDEEKLADRPDLVTFVMSDPARSISPTAAYSGIVVVSLDLSRPAIYVRDVVNVRCLPSERRAHIIRLCKRWNADVVGEEDTGLSLESSEPIISDLQRNGLYHVTFLPITAHRGKEEFSSDEGAKVGRAMPLSGYFKNHIVFFNKACVDILILEDQLENCPDNTYWDLLDAFAHVLQAMTKLGLHFVNYEVETVGVDGTSFNPQTAPLERLQHHWADLMPLHEDANVLGPNGAYVRAERIRELEDDRDLAIAAYNEPEWDVALVASSFDF